MNVDQRIEKTYSKLLSAFDKLMAEKRYEDISVALLCRRAEIRRTTFYKHFADKDEFFAFFLLSVRDDLLAAIGTASGNETLASYLNGTIQQLILYLECHRALVDNILASSAADRMASILCDVIAHDIAAHIKKSDLSGPEALASPEALSVFLAGGIVHSIRHWWGHEDSEIARAGVYRMSEYLLMAEQKSGRQASGTEAASPDPLRQSPHAG